MLINKIKRLSIFFVLISLLLGSEKIKAQSKQIETIKKAISTWQAFNERVQISNLGYSSSPDSMKYMGGTATLFGQTTRLEVEFMDTKKKRLKRLMINFPSGAKLTTNDFRAIIGQDFNAIMPQGIDMGVGLQKFEIVFDGRRKNRVDGATLAFILGSWAPFQEEKNISLNEIKASFQIGGIATGRKNLQVALSSYLFFPQELANKLHFGQTKLQCSGKINTQTKTFEIAAGLNSQGIPLVSDRSVMLNMAEIVFAYSKGKPKLALRGQMQLMDNGRTLMPALNGFVSIDVTGTIYGEAWMSQGGEWKNPFNLNPNLSITRMGIGFGVNFKTTPIPTPILAMEGGLIAKNRSGSTLFNGRATVGVDMGDPSRNMIDAMVKKVPLSQVVDVFSKAGLPRGFSKELKKIGLQNLHFTLVPPGEGVKIFGIDYEPGFYAEGSFSYGKQRGAMFIDIKEDQVEAFGGLSNINYSGFSLTGATPGTSPHMFLSFKPAQQQYALAINGKVKALGVSALTDVYLSDDGFNVLLDGNIFNTFHAKLDVAGKSLTSGSGGIYVKAMMEDQDNLVQKISREASQEINKLADKLNKDYDAQTANLERLRPQLQKAKTNLEAKQKVVRAKWQRWCSLMDQRNAQNEEKRNKQTAITNLKKEINRLETNLRNDRYKRAIVLNNTTCGSNSKAYQNYCYKPAPGFNWDILQPINGSRATFKPERRETKNAIVRGKFDVFKNGVRGCPSGQWGDAIQGKCYTCPSGYKKDGVMTRCVKIHPKQFKAAVKGSYIGCGSNGSFKDLLTAKCYKCPSGYARKVSVHSITSDKACELKNIAQRETTIRNKRLELAKLETEMTVITRGLGELATKLSGAGSNICQKIKNTDAINADPSVAPAFTKWSALSLQVEELQKAVKLVQTTQVGGLRAAAWVVKKGGQALKIVDIDYASFEGCLSTVSNGTVALKVKGRYAGQPLNASFKINIKNPTPDIKRFANLLLSNPNPKTTHSNGSCRRPNVKRPDVSDTKVEELMQYLNKNVQPKLKPAPKKEEKPAWAGEVRFNGDR